MSSNSLFTACSTAAIASAMAIAFASPAQAQNATLRAEIDAIKVELASLQTVAAGAATMAQAVQELSSKVVVLEQELAKNGSLRESMPEAINTIDAMETELRALRTELEYVRTRIANIEQPAASSGGAGIERADSGWYWTTADGKYGLGLTGYFQPRYETRLPVDLDTQDYSTFRARRGRVRLLGQLGARVDYAVGLELTSLAAPMRDFYFDMKYSPAFSVRVGQARVPFAKSFLAFSRDRDFIELTDLQDRHRYDRDIGVWALGGFLDQRLRYQAGVSNGAGPNQVNDNVDMLLSARVEGVALGEYIAPGFGDHLSTETPSLTLGLAMAHDMVRVGPTIAGIEVGNRDVDGDGVLDNLRVISGAIDAQFRYLGFEAFVEGTFRHERWGTILDHEDNSDVEALVRPSDSGRRNYLAFSAQASYFILPHRLQAGARVSHGRMPLLGLGGIDFDQPPAAQRLLQTDAFVQLWREGFRRVGMTYSLTNFNEIDGPDPENDMKHQLVVEAQLIL